MIPPEWRGPINDLKATAGYSAEARVAIPGRAHTGE